MQILLYRGFSLQVLNQSAGDKWLQFETGENVSLKIHKDLLKIIVSLNFYAQQLAL